MRIRGIFAPSDLVEDDEQGRALFSALFPGDADPRIDQDHVGLAIAAHNPAMALLLARLSRLLAVDSAFGQRPVLRELVIQTVNLHFGADYARSARARVAPPGMSAQMLSALPDWQESSLFDEEQRRIIAYAQAVLSGDVPRELFAALLSAYGERAVVELTGIIGLWSAWAMLLNAMGPGIDDGEGVTPCSD